jgi:uncharacterized protein YgbK (DUF1537 family)
MIGVIADDLSGAAELGAVGLRHGLRAELVVAGHCGSEADLICVDTDSRGCNAAEAGALARAAARELTNAGAQWIYKKVDSVLRGQIVVEVRGVMTELNLPRALLVPANPSLGRVIRDGKYFVGGELLHETEFARDPQHPRHSSAVNELLRGAEVRVCKLSDPLPEAGIVVGEAASADDLREWAQRVEQRILPAGAAEFFGALLTASKPMSTNPPRADLANMTASGQLFVCGSTSESSRKFVEEAQRNGAVVFSLPENLGAGGDFSQDELRAIAGRAMAALAQRRRVILNIAMPLVRETAVAKSLAVHLVNLAGRIMENSEVGRVYAEGGETAAALVRRMGWGRLTVLRELALGVVTVGVEGKGNLHFTLKPGTYAWPETVRQGRD